jgi:agmatinase
MDYQNLKESIEFLDSGQPPAENAGLFGVNPDPLESLVVLMPVRWEGTASYIKGAALGPEAIIQASHQLDLMDIAFGRPYSSGISMVDGFRSFSSSMRVGEEDVDGIRAIGLEINEAVFSATEKWLNENKIVGIIGGEHSVPLGAIQAVNKKFSDFGILHIDAHHDLREAYEGFENSHASIMYNVLKTCPNMSQLVSVGIRDFSLEEFEAAKSDRVKTFYDGQLKRQQFEGGSWKESVSKIIGSLPDNVYISFDIDGLLPELCPNTGTPVPGGISFEQTNYLLEELASSGKSVVGFDLCETSPDITNPDDEWDGNVAARVLYKICGAAITANLKGSS